MAADLGACRVRSTALRCAEGLAVSQRDDRFRVRPGAPKARQSDRLPRFVTRVLREASKSGAKRSTRPGGRSAAKLGRGHVAASMAGRRLGANARRVVIKTRLVVLKQAGARSVESHLRYIEREGVDRDGGKGLAYGAMTDQAVLSDFEERGRGDRHQFRFIVSPEDAQSLEDLRGFTRHLMTRMEADLGTRLDWVAVDHWNTDNPHTHIVLRGKDETGHDLIIARDYIAQGMRQRACELATEWLGSRSDREIREGLSREVNQERWTSLDRSLQQLAHEGIVDLAAATEAQVRAQRTLLIGRLQRLTTMGLAEPAGVNRWELRADLEPTLRAMGERSDIVRTMQRAVGSLQRELAVFSPGETTRPVVGRVIDKGLADELHDRGYLVVDGIDGRAHYVPLNTGADLSRYSTGAVVEARGSTEFRAADKTIAALASDGVYRTDHHLAVARASVKSDRDPKDVVAAHVRRLEALRRAGHVERVAEGVWRVPADLPERGRQYDAQRLDGSTVSLQSHLPVERQTRVIGATWLDRQLIGGAAGVVDYGFGSEVREALRQRTDFLVEQGLAERRGSRVIFARDLLATMRGSDIDIAAKAIATETGLAHRAVLDGEAVTGVYRRSVQLASGLFAMLDDGIGFSLVPWKPVIEQRLGQTMTAVTRGGGVSWAFGRQHGPGVG
jgi:type IV secretory pathway VirD2 relaxase